MLKVMGNNINFFVQLYNSSSFNNNDYTHPITKTVTSFYTLFLTIYRSLWTKDRAVFLICPVQNFLARIGKRQLVPKPEPFSLGEVMDPAKPTRSLAELETDIANISAALVTVSINCM